MIQVRLLLRNMVRLRINKPFCAHMSMTTWSGLEFPLSLSWYGCNSDGIKAMHNAATAKEFKLREEHASGNCLRLWLGGHEEEALHAEDGTAILLLWILHRHQFPILGFKLFGLS